MTTLFGWIKDCFNYYFFGQVKEELIDKITKDDEITNDVKDDLVKSIMMDNPTQFVAKMNDGRNRIPTNLKEDLMRSMMRASQMYVSPIENLNNRENDKYPPVEDEPKNKKKYEPVISEKPTVVDIEELRQLKHADEMKQTNKNVNARGNNRRKNHNRRNWKKTYNLVMNQMKFKEFIRNMKYETNVMNEQEQFIENFNKVLESIRAIKMTKVKQVNSIKNKNDKENDDTENKTTGKIQYKGNVEINKYDNLNTYRMERKGKKQKKRNNVLMRECKWNQHY